jgi:DNA-binding SARP family transcriptional activator
MLWPEADSDRGRRLLSDSVYRINQALGDEALVASGDDLRLNTAVLPSDVSEFERAVLVGEHEHAAALYMGPFLDGFHLPDSAEFEQWLAEERSRYAGEAARSVEALAGAAEEEGKWTASVAWWRRAAALAPDSSRIALRLMRALEASGDRAAAIRHAAIHGTLVRESLGIEPDAAIERYVASLRADGGRAVSDPVRSEPLPDGPPSIAPTEPASAVEPSAATESQDRRQSDRRQQSGSNSRRIRWVAMSGAVVALVIAAFSR